LTSDKNYGIIVYVVKGDSTPFTINATNNNILEEFADGKEYRRIKTN
jgi:hypothetical protein